MRGVLLVGKAAEPSLAEVPAEAPASEKPAGLYDRELAAQAIQKGGCIACHTIPGIPGAVGSIGPNLGDIGKAAKDRIAKGEYKGAAKTAEEYITESLESPDVYISLNCPTGPCGKGVMPASLAQLLPADEIKSVVTYLAALPV